MRSCLSPVPTKFAWLADSDSALELPSNASQASFGVAVGVNLEF